MSGEVRFSETLRGFVSPFLAGRSHEEHARDGARGDGAILFMLTVITADVDALIADVMHRSPVFGCVLAPCLGGSPLRVEHGYLDLFVDAHAADEEAVVLHMRYHLTLIDDDDPTRRFVLRGVKEVVRTGLIARTVRDTTTLFVDVWRADDDGAPVLRGILKEGVVGVIAQGLSFRGDVGGIARYLGYYVRRVLQVALGPRRSALRANWAQQPRLPDERRHRRRLSVGEGG